MWVRVLEDNKAFLPPFIKGEIREVSDDVVRILDLINLKVVEPVSAPATREKAIKSKHETRVV